MKNVCETLSFMSSAMLSFGASTKFRMVMGTSGNSGLSLSFFILDASRPQFSSAWRGPGQEDRRTLTQRILSLHRFIYSYIHVLVNTNLYLASNRVHVQSASHIFSSVYSISIQTHIFSSSSSSSFSSTHIYYYLSHAYAGIVLSRSANYGSRASLLVGCSSLLLVGVTRPLFQGC
jgi:hypothetical protein